MFVQQRRVPEVQEALEHRVRADHVHAGLRAAAADRAAASAHAPRLQLEGGRQGVPPTDRRRAGHHQAAHRPQKLDRYPGFGFFLGSDTIDMMMFLLYLRKFKLN
jgi:hypothetical protein